MDRLWSLAQSQFCIRLVSESRRAPLLGAMPLSSPFSLSGLSRIDRLVRRVAGGCDTAGHRTVIFGFLAENLKTQAVVFGMAGGRR